MPGVWALGFFGLGVCTRLTGRDSEGGGLTPPVAPTSAIASDGTQFLGPELQMYVILKNNTEAERIMDDRELLKAQLAKTFTGRGFTIMVTNVRKQEGSNRGTQKYVVDWKTSSGGLSQDEVIEITGSKGEKVTSQLWSEQAEDPIKTTPVMFKLTNTLNIPTTDGKWKEILVTADSKLTQEQITICKIKHSGVTHTKKNVRVYIWWTIGQCNMKVDKENVIAWSGQDMDLTKTDFSFKIAEHMTIPADENGWKDHLTHYAEWGKIHTAKVNYLGVDGTGKNYECEVFWYQA